MTCVSLGWNDLTRPNDIAFWPDEKYLYVTNADEKKKVIVRYDVNANATLKNGRVLFDMTSSRSEDALNGMKVDKRGYLYVSAHRAGRTSSGHCDCAEAPSQHGLG